MNELERLEHAAYQRQPDRPQAMLACLRAAAMGVPINFASVPPPSAVAIWTRLASAFCAVFSDPDLSLSERDVERILVLKSALDRVFLASAFASSDFLLKAIAEADENAMRDAGLTHLLSISGLHVTLLGWLGGVVIGRCWRLRSAWLLVWPAPVVARWGGLAVAVGFLGVLTVGFAYEWKKGALEWQ